MYAIANPDDRSVQKNNQVITLLAISAFKASRVSLYPVRVQFNPFTPKNDQFQISSAASPVILRRTVWRTWLFISYSDERWLHNHILTASLIHFSTECWENAFFELGTATGTTVTRVPLYVLPLYLCMTRTYNYDLITNTSTQRLRTVSVIWAAAVDVRAEKDQIATFLS